MVLMKSSYLIKHQATAIIKCSSYEQLVKQLTKINIQELPSTINEESWKQSKKYWEEFLSGLEHGKDKTLKEQEKQVNKTPANGGKSDDGTAAAIPPSSAAKSANFDRGAIAAAIGKVNSKEEFKDLLIKYNLFASSPDEYLNVSSKEGASLSDWLEDAIKTAQGQITKAEYLKRIEKNIARIAGEGYTSSMPMDNAILRTPKELSNEAHEVIRILIRHAFEFDKSILRDKDRGYYVPIKQDTSYEITWNQLHLGRQHANKQVIQEALDELMGSFINIQRKNPQKSKKKGFDFCGKFQWLDAVMPTEQGIKFLFGQTFFTLIREINSVHNDGYTRHLHAASNYGIRSDKSYMYEFFASFIGQRTQEYTKEELYKQFKIDPTREKTVALDDGGTEQVTVKTRYSDIKHHYLIPAIKEINRKAEFTVEIIETKLPTNKKEIQYIQFKVIKKVNQDHQLL